jgi:hypothetical protein
MLALIVLRILLTWLLCAAVCIGNGFLLLKGLRFTGSLTEALWTGLALITAFLQLYHFFRPVDIVAVFLLSSLGLAGWLWKYAMHSPNALAGRAPLPPDRVERKKSQLAEPVLLVLGTAIIAFRCAALGDHYDTGLYGAQAVRWFVTCPLVPGLGNLLAQLGFNSSVFLCIAALDQGPWRDLAHHLFDGFLIAALFASIFPAGVRILRNESNSASDWFFALLFIPATIWATTSKIVGTNTDLPASIVCLVAAATLFRALEGESPQAGGSDSNAKSLLIAMALFSLAVTFKISSVVFALLGWIVAILKLWSMSRNTPPRKRRMAWALILSTAIVLPWIGRGLVLTGYPFFPSTALSISVDWKVPGAVTQGQADFARSFARVPELTTGYAHGWKWLGPWFREMLTEREGFVIPLLIALAGSVAGIIRMRRQNRGSSPQWLWLLMPALGGLIFWFLEAPALRFGEPVIWTAGATLGTLAAIHFLSRHGRTRIALAGLVVLTAWAAHPRLLWSSYFRPSVGVRTFLRLPEARVMPHRTNSGLLVNVPVETNQCWNAPLPCSPYFNETLRLREPGKLERGFAVEESGTAVKWK